MDRTLIASIRDGLESAANPRLAAGMQAYMKSAMPYYGVPSPQLKVIWRSTIDRRRLRNPSNWRATALGLWRAAKFREERYAAIALTGARAYRDWQTLDTVAMYEEMIVTGAWWDYVDAIASRRIGPLLQRYPGRMSRLMLRWSHSPDLWKRRTSIICQLSFKERTDLPLLYACIEPSLDDGEFFIRKAIGWALRQYAWTNPGEVQRYVREHRDRLSGLSQREALKNIGSRRAARDDARRLGGTGR
jgi:3-methyladenine DNA glycosylase AlkD